MARIVIVEDDLAIREMVTRGLTSSGHEVEVADNGQEGLDLIRKERPDLVLLDVNLPVMDGYDVCRHIRRDPDIAKTPVVMLTAAYTQSHHADHGFESGADEYIVKPFAWPVLLHNIERLLGRPAADPEHGGAHPGKSS